MKKDMITVPCPIAGVSVIYTGGGAKRELKRIYGDRTFISALIRFLGAMRVMTGMSILYTQGVYNYRRKRGGKQLSLHAYGRAVDITGFKVHHGVEIWVSSDWGNSKYARFWRLAVGAMIKASSPHGVEIVTPSDDPINHKDHIHWGLKI